MTGIAKVWHQHLGSGVERSLFQAGYAHIPQVLSAQECRELRTLSSQKHMFRHHIVMERHRLGQGDYAYFADPLPPLVATLRTTLYTFLAPLANAMMEALQAADRYPRTLEAFRRQCRRAGQTRPTPLLLHYTAGGFNCLHRDIYGPLVFPLQAMIMLSQPGKEFTGGEFVLVENLPRQQARAIVLSPGLGDMIIFPVHTRPVPGKRGMRKASIRHGVSPILSGTRWVLGIIFHDAT
ncbi:MAG: proline hydroxylase [Nitrospirae bacterium]|nr:MAG: proline hydroxylase [Nitrospirota bacterium]